MRSVIKKAVQFGAGNIGRGFLGQLLAEGGYATTFVDTDAALVERLNRRGQYPLRLVSDRGQENLMIGPVRAADILADPEVVIQSLTEADLAGTSVGASNLARIAPVLAAGINARARLGAVPLNILLCENQWHAASLMRSLLRPQIAPEALAYFDQHIGLVETVIGRMVPQPTAAVRAEDPLLILAEPYRSLPVAQAALRGPVPALPGLILAEPFEAYEARKLFLHNMSHAALAYLGAPRRHSLIWQCAGDAVVSEICAGATAEVCAALTAEYGLEPEPLADFTADLQRRFANSALGDSVARVAADPLRKLRRQDRLVGAALLCERHGIEPRRLAQVIAAALAYAVPGDPTAPSQVQCRREILTTVCALEPDSSLAQLIASSGGAA